MYRTPAALNNDL